VKIDSLGEENVKIKLIERLPRSLRRRLAPMIDFVGNLLKILKPRAREVRSQIMVCPFCGLITPRAKRCCLECGKPLRATQAQAKSARQE
jgi:hypothetical protein